MAFIKPAHMRQFAQQAAPALRAFTPRLALRALSTEVPPRANSNIDPVKTTPLLDRDAKKANFWTYVKNIGALTFGAGTLALGAHWTSQMEREEFGFKVETETQSPTEKRLETIMQPHNRASATNDISLLANEILSELKEALFLDGCVSTKETIEENLSKSYFTGPEATLNFALHVIKIKIASDYTNGLNFCYPGIAPTLMRNAYYHYADCRRQILLQKELSSPDGIFEYKNKGLSALPVEIEQIPDLEMLFLRENNIQYIPPQIGNLPKLRHLDLKYNNLTKLPAEIGNLPNLEYLDLQHNQLTGLPPQIGKLEKLTSLDLGYNNFTSIPKILTSFKTLNSLNIEGYLTKGQNVSYNDFTFWELRLLKKIRENNPSCLIEKDRSKMSEPDQVKSTTERAKGLFNYLTSKIL